MWHETCTQGYQKCDMCTGFSDMWHETYVQGYQKCDMRHVHRIIRTVTWDMCTGLSEMGHETCAQGYQKCDMIHVHRVIRNVTWYMCTGLSEIWHETCAHVVCVYDVQRSCVCYCVGFVFVIVWQLYLLLCGGLCLLLCVSCVCYYVGVVFVIVIFVRLLKFNNIRRVFINLSTWVRRNNLSQKNIFYFSM